MALLYRLSSAANWIDECADDNYPWPASAAGSETTPPLSASAVRATTVAKTPSWPFGDVRSARSDLIGQPWCYRRSMAPKVNQCWECWHNPAHSFAHAACAHVAKAGAAPGSSGDASAPSGAAAPAGAAPAVQPPIVGCHGALSEGDHREQVAIFRSLAKTHHGAHEDLVTPPRKTRRTGLACGGPLSPVDIQEQQAMFASIVAQAHGETIEVADDSVDLEAELETLLDGVEAERVGGASELPGDLTD
ncbi:unnamed protein product [Prorocentrum cordatum]|uniref:Uncharacterized protein n=1 Tax=Prorocentrum cordatum TaxID=2364126 RepID=A0ABN9QUT9_9DINO|nr:unnamed protein product [Polarella glacialis]